MQIPGHPEYDPSRVDYLRQQLRRPEPLEADPESPFDRLSRLARRLFDVPIALVSLVDANRQWCKSCVGVGVAEHSRDMPFCAHAGRQNEVFVVRDAQLDDRFRDNPLVVGDSQIRFYAGCPLVLENGHKIGTLCISDRVARDFNDDDLALLQDLARVAEHELTSLQESITDPLTGMSNRAGFTMLGAHTLRVCNRLGTPVSLLCLDVAAADPEANQLFGVPDDDAIVSFAGILQRTFADSEVIARVGTEQFAVMTSDSRGSAFDSAMPILQRAVEAHNEHAGCGPLLAYDAGSAIGDPSYEIDFDLLFSAAATEMRPQIQVRDSCGAATEWTPQVPNAGP